MSSNNDSSGSDLEISPCTRIALQYIGIASFVLILLFFIINYIREAMRRRYLDTTTTAIPKPRNGGLDVDDISLLPKFIYRPSTRSFRKEKHNDDHKGKLSLYAECAVCISELEDGDMVRVLPMCKHFFHVKCIDIWLYAHSTCPMCRAYPEPEKVKQGAVSSSPPLPQLRRCETMPERYESVSFRLSHGSSLQGSPCMFMSPRVSSREVGIEVLVLDDSETIEGVS